MTQIDRKAEVAKHQEELLADLQGILRIKSVLDEENAT